MEARLCALLGKTPAELDEQDSDRLFAVLELAGTYEAVVREKTLEAIAKVIHGH